MAYATLEIEKLLPLLSYESGKEEPFICAGIAIVIGLKRKSRNEQILYLSSIIKLWIVLYVESEEPPCVE
jgi:hypothetical protein